MGKKIVYWGLVSDFANHFLLDLEPKPLLKNLAINQVDSNFTYLSCPAVRDRHRNTFFSTIPFDTYIEFNSNGFISNKPEIHPRQSAYKNSYALELQVQRIFFCETPQMMEVTPAFLHNTSYAQYGHAPSGAFDIGKWFRPSSPNFQLWEGVTKFTAKEGEPHLYFNFPSDDKIELKQFYFTGRLESFMYSNLNHKLYIPNQSLSKIYERFNRSGQKRTILEEIKNNLV
jgi:hypothetical protein